MSEYKDRERFIPLTTSDIVENLSGELKSKEKERFERFSLILENLIHHEFQEKIEELEELYFPFDPDTDKISLKDSPDLTENKDEFYEKITKLLEKSNFNKIDEEELEYALEEDSEIAVEVEINKDDFEDLLLFKRGETKRKDKIPKYFWIFRKFFKKDIELDIYERIVMIIKFDESYDPKKTSLKKDIQKDKIHLKIFKNVPKKDIEMILPNPKIKMSLIDKLKIGLPVLIGIGAGAAKFLRVIQGTSETIVTISVLIALAGYMIKSYVSYKNTILDYVTNLTSGLYFKNLGNNESVMHYLTNEAEEEEVKEMILAYHFIYQNQGISIKDLDDKVEKWFEDKGIYIDWEVKDAVNKLEKHELIKKYDGDGLKVIGLDKALVKLDNIWDEYFEYSA